MSSAAYDDGCWHGKEGAEMNPVGRSWEREAQLCGGCRQVRLPSVLSKNVVSAPQNSPSLPFSLKLEGAAYRCITPNYADLLPQLIFGGCTLPQGCSAGAAPPMAMPPLSRKRQGSVADATEEVRG